MHWDFHFPERNKQVDEVDDKVDEVDKKTLQGKIDIMPSHFKCVPETHAPDFTRVFSECQAQNLRSEQTTAQVQSSS